MTLPVLKWVGGKRQVLDTLHAQFPTTHESFHEPFIGGGAVFFDHEPVAGTINDVNTRLTNYYTQLRDRPEAVINELETFNAPDAPPDTTQRFADTDRDGDAVDEYYYQQRARFNNRVHGDAFNAVEEAALLQYLNRTCFNGLYRENRDGEFNAPIGSYANPDWVQRERVHAASDVLQGTAIQNQDFAYITDVASRGDVVYFDPPYEPVSASSDFTEYSAARFDRDDQERLLSVAEALVASGVSVVVSNSGVMCDVYDAAGFDVVTVDASRRINCDAENRGAVDEIIATSVSPEARCGAEQLTLTAARFQNTACSD